MRSRTIHVVVAICCLALIGTACSKKKPEAPSSTLLEVSVNATEPAAKKFAFQGMPATFKPGLIDLTLNNKGAQPHEMQIVRVDGTRTWAEFAKTFDAPDGAAIPDWLHGAGGEGVVQPGGATQAQINLTPGMYFFVCTQGDPAHYKQGMRGSFIVSPGSGTGALPSTPGKIVAKEYSFTPTGIKAGDNLVTFENAGKEIHVAVAFPLNNGKTVEDVKKAFASNDQSHPPPFDETRPTSLAATDGGTAFVGSFNIQAGRYVLVCFLNDRAGGPPHFMKGMLQELDVA